MTYAVEVKELTFAYPQADPVLSGVDFSIRAGETVVLAGLSGSGKTTLAHIISGIIPQLIKGELSGEVRLFGADIKNKTPAALASQVALVFQDSDEQLICTTVEDELAFGPENLCLPPREITALIDRALAKYHLSELRLQDPAKLSGGQKKLVAVAAVSMLGPRLVIFDEPLSGLDEANRALVRELIAEIKAAGQTVLIVEHDLAEPLARAADRWLILDGGRIAAYAAPEELLDGRLLYELELIYDD